MLHPNLEGEDVHSKTPIPAVSHYVYCDHMVTTPAVTMAFLV